MIAEGKLLGRVLTGKATAKNNSKKNQIIPAAKATTIAVTISEFGML
jgi:hypothetical protein|tara:strand:+ start:12194 stop:12334 length:141 start_codon:yes stop_codon:yes gene_type:complete